MMARVYDRPSTQKEQSLEGGVGGEMEHACCWPSTTHRHNHVAQLRESGIGKNTFYIILLHRN